MRRHKCGATIQLHGHTAENRGFDVTISSTTDRVSFEGNGVTTSFSLPFRFFSNSDIQASLIDDETGLVTPLSFWIDYTLLGASAPEQAGSTESVLDATVAPSIGKTLFVQRVMEFVQPTDIVNQGRFFPEVHETVFDRLTMLVQQAALGTSRTIRVPEFDPIPGRLPSANARATKVFGFDENGDPVVSSLSLSAIEAQVPLAQGFAQAAAASADESALSAFDSGQSAIEAGESRDDAAAIASSLTGAAIPLFSVMWWPSRQIPEGYVAADGQALSRATYPDAWAGIQAGNVPTVADATWSSTPTERGKFTSGNGATTFRLPDYNGKFAGSLGAVFLRGDGVLSAAVAGVIQQDALQGHHHNSSNATGATTGTGGILKGTGVGSLTITGDVLSPITDGVNGTPRTAAESRPINVTGCWVIKLFGAVVNVGSADAAQLASDYANLSGRVSTLESIGKPFTKAYASSEQVITAGGLLTLTHGIGSTPKLVLGWIVNKVADQGYSVGDIVQVPLSIVSSSITDSFGAQVKIDATSVNVRYGTACFIIGNWITGASVEATRANWRLIVRAFG